MLIFHTIATVDNALTSHVGQNNSPQEDIQLCPSHFRYFLMDSLLKDLHFRGGDHTPQPGTLIKTNLSWWTFNLDQAENKCEYSVYYFPLSSLISGLLVVFLISALSLWGRRDLLCLELTHTLGKSSSFSFTLCKLVQFCKRYIRPIGSA